MGELARAVGRGRRSAIGTHGFAQGGLLFELGQQSRRPLAELADRVELPEAWRVVLLMPTGAAGLCGDEENDAFRQLPPVPSRVTRQLLREVRQSMLPAAHSADLEAFGESVYRYGVQAGMCFARQQGGPFASPLLQQWVDAIRRRGVQGVGQSSWGPTLFAFLPDEDAAGQFVDWFRRDVLTAATSASVTVAQVANHGARIEATQRPPHAAHGPHRRPATAEISPPSRGNAEDFC